MQSPDPIQIISPLEMKARSGARVDTYLHASTRPGFNAYETTGGFGNMLFQHHPGNGFDIWHSSYTFTRGDHFTNRANIPVLELHFPLTGSYHSQWDGFYNITFKEKQFDLSYAPFIHQQSCVHAGQSFQTFDIHYTKDYLQRFAHYPLMTEFLNKVEQGKPANLLGGTQFLNPAMIRTVHDLLTADMDPQTLPYFYEANAFLLLTMVLDRLGVHESTRGYTPHDLESTTHARDLITLNLHHKYSIPELARLTALSETKLQICFKQLFDTTIFDYHQSLRLDHARILLKTTPYTIQHIAFQCGYNDHANLTAAFKKRFGCTPDYYRKNS